jgi:hypothetical protein
VKQKTKKKKKKGNTAPEDGVATPQDRIEPIASRAIIAKAGSNEMIQSPSSPPDNTSKKEWKARKKQKAKAKKEGNDDFDKALDELSMK